MPRWKCGRAMRSIEAPHALCVSIHDVAPATWELCAKLFDAIRDVADIPVTLLVVPAYHHREEAPPTYLRAL